VDLVHTLQRNFADVALQFDQGVFAQLILHDIFHLDIFFTLRRPAVPMRVHVANRCLLSVVGAVALVVGIDVYFKALSVSLRLVRKGVLRKLGVVHLVGVISLHSLQRVLRPGAVLEPRNGRTAVRPVLVANDDGLFVVSLTLVSVVIVCTLVSVRAKMI
jgi:hypothetical protein